MIGDDTGGKNGADNRSRTYDLRITNATLLYFYPFKNPLLKQ